MVYLPESTVDWLGKNNSLQIIWSPAKFIINFIIYFITQWIVPSICYA